jgi:hypothetical protein
MVGEVLAQRQVGGGVSQGRILEADQKQSRGQNNG